ncbi:hypothetical protein M433DRAFT_155204 [Acidomyces richmondensis BFW]|nr:MAG: hypothetical protein FE78DRAFT_89641 [Acidomyces sp. 'richmondensis']KYG44786.1 hypothetical protein M433DRAFT_155204 [Acidomyces richmondensis BFW]
MDRLSPTGRRRATSDVTSDDARPTTSRNQDAGERQRIDEEESEFRVPPLRRAATTMVEKPPLSPGARSHRTSGELEAGLRRRSTRRSNLGAGRPSTVARRSNFAFSVAGPSEETPQMKMAQENYVHPGYEALNPSYAMPANARPVWSLAKPLPRVVRPGMVPTKSEILESRVNAELPGENSQKLGLDVDPNDLEKGKMGLTLDRAKLSAQLKDSRAQRENNFLNTLQQYGQTATRSKSQRLSRVGSITSSARRRRASTSATRPAERLSPAWEEDEGMPPSDETEPEQEKLPPRRSTNLAPIPETRVATPEEPANEQQKQDADDDDAATLTTLHEDDEPALYEDMEPLMQNFVEDEIHNNHTAWSVIRTHHREFLAEMLAVFVQLFCGFCLDVAATVEGDKNPNTTAFGWGFATMSAIYISGGISGAHLNPSITTMLWWYRGFPKRKIPEYWAAQFLGALIAGFVAYALYSASIHNYLASNSETDIIDSFVTSQRHPWITPGIAFFNECMGTTILVITVLALGDDQNAPPGAGMNAFIIGLLITLLTLCFAYQTGAALNPSRDFGPRLALLALGYPKTLFTNPYWLYGPWAGSLAGSALGAFIYDAAVFTGGESPINYPWSRTRRALRKSRAKWSRRLHLKKKDALEDDI